MVTRTVTWGDALLVVAVKSPGGLNQTVQRIRKAVGPNIGTRNSFAKLYRVDNPAELAPVDLWRAWLLLTAVEERPEDWGISPEIVPPAIDGERLRERLIAAARRTQAWPSDYIASISDIRTAHTVRTRPSTPNGSTRPRGRVA